MARKAYSLDTLLNQVNSMYPDRSKISDGWIGDSAHQAVKSEHNPNAEGVVTALDITHDPANGADMNQLASALLRSGDSRIWYIIFNRRIWEGGVWTPYYGSNPHDKHLHISTSQSKQQYDDGRPWNLNLATKGVVMTEDGVRYGYLAVSGGIQPAEKDVRYWTGRNPEEFMKNLYGQSDYYMVDARRQISALHKQLASTQQPATYTPVTETLYRKAA